MIRITPFGGCLIHNPLAEFYRRKKTFGLYSKQNGFGSRPFSLSANTNLQLIDFMTGKAEIPQWIRSYIYFEAVNEPTVEQGQKFLSGEIALAELSTPTEYLFDRFLLNVNRFEMFIKTVQEALPAERKLIGTWHRALKQANEEARKPAADQIVSLIPEDTPERENMVRFVGETTSRMLTVDDMTASMAELRDRLGIPAAMVIHNFSYMPDGRPISWPADFKENTIEVARRLDIPTVDFADFVKAEGVDKVLSFDRRHYEPTYLVPVGEMMNDFCVSVLDPTSPKPSSARTQKAKAEPSQAPGEQPAAELQSREFRIKIGQERARLNEALGKARAIDRAAEPQLFLEMWKNVLILDPNNLAAIRRVVGGAAYLRDYGQLAEAVIRHLEVTPGDSELGEKLARSAVRSGLEVRALEFLANQELVDLSVRPIEQLHKRVVQLCKAALATNDAEQALRSFRALELADEKHPEVEALRPALDEVKALHPEAAEQPDVQAAATQDAATLQAPATREVGPAPLKEPTSEDEVRPRQYQFDRNTGGQLPTDPSTIYAVVVLGGAWASGANGDADDKAISVSAEHPGKALMFDVGVRPRGRETSLFTDLQENSGASSKETPCAGIADQVLRNCQTRFGLKPNMLFFSVSRGGTSLSGQGMTTEDGLLRGSVQHREVMRLVDRAREIAADRGDRLEVAAICLLHGEYEAGEGSPGSAYRRSLSALQLQYDADIRALTRQTEPVRLYLTQTNRASPRAEPEIPLAQLNAKFDNPHVQCVGPTYFTSPEARDSGPATHLTAPGYRRIGQLFGRFLLDDLWGVSRDPLRVEDAYWVGEKTIRVRYNRAVHLEEDDSRVNVAALGQGLGVDFNDGTQWSPSVEAVKPVRGRETELDVELTAPSSGYRKRLLIAARPTGEGGVGRLQGARSGIRSKEAFDIDPLDGAELFDWACTEVVALR